MNVQQSYENIQLSNGSDAVHYAPNSDNAILVCAPPKQLTQRNQNNSADTARRQHISKRVHSRNLKLLLETDYQNQSGEQCYGHKQSEYQFIYGKKSERTLFALHHRTIGHRTVTAVLIIEPVSVVIVVGDGLDHKYDSFYKKQQKYPSPQKQVIQDRPQLCEND